MWPGHLCIEVVPEPLLGFVLLTLGAVPVATGMLDTVLAPTGVALIEAVAVVAAAALLDGAEDLAVCQGELGVALHVFWSKGGADLAESGHDRHLPSGVDAWSS